jgi:hypothetical protein
VTRCAQQIAAQHRGAPSLAIGDFTRLAPLADHRLVELVGATA